MAGSGLHKGHCFYHFFDEQSFFFKTLLVFAHLFVKIIGGQWARIAMSLIGGFHVTPQALCFCAKTELAE